jgi:hypothetical protein
MEGGAVAHVEAREEHAPEGGSVEREIGRRGRFVGHGSDLTEREPVRPRGVRLDTQHLAALVLGR